MKVYVVFLMNDFGAVNPGIGSVLPTFSVAGGRYPGPMAEVGVTWPSVHEAIPEIHQYLFARNSAVAAFADSATNSAAVAISIPTSIKKILRIFALAI
jgi:hypothetical protein